MSNGITGSIEIGRRALMAQQAVLNTVGHNLANATTPGYTRQRVNLIPVNPRDGVAVNNIERVRDRFLDFQLLTEGAASKSADARQGTLERLESVFNDPAGANLGATIDQLFQGFQDLSVHPTDPTVRVTVQTAGQQVADTFKTLHGNLDQLKQDVASEIQQRVSQANSLLDQIVSVQQELAGLAGQETPNDVLDRRDQLVSQLNDIVGVSMTDRKNGEVQLAVTGTGILLIDGQRAAKLSAVTNYATDTVDLSVGGTAVTPKGGALDALIDERNSATGSIKQASSDLDSLAASIIDNVNRIHASGSGLTEHTTLTSGQAVSSAAVALDSAGLSFPPGSGSFRVVVHDASGAVASSVTVPVTAATTTLDDVRATIATDPNLTATITGGKLTISAATGKTFSFGDDTSGALAGLGLNTFFTGSSAFTIGLDPLVAGDASKIAAARPDAAGLVHAGDGSNALGMAQLRTGLTMAGGTDTFTGAYGTLVGRVGSAKQNADNTVERQDAAFSVVQGLQQQTSGVSTDEELINLTQAQSAYAAAAHYITTINDIFATLLDMTR